MKKNICFVLLSLVLLVGCAQADKIKTVTIENLDRSSYEIHSEQAFESPYNKNPYSFAFEEVLEDHVIGSVLDTYAHPRLFVTEFLFTHGKDGFEKIPYHKKNRIADVTEYQGKYYYMTYYYDENDILFSDLFRYIDGENDELIEQFELDGSSLYLAPAIEGYDNGFVIIMAKRNEMKIYKYSNDSLELIYTDESTPDGNIVPSLSQIKGDTLYTIQAQEEGNTLIEVDLMSNEIKKHKTDMKFARYCVMEDYIVIFDTDNNREIVYDKDMKQLWTSDFDLEIVRWTEYVDGNTLVYSDNMTHDLYIRNFDTDISYRIPAEGEALLEHAPVGYDVWNDTIYFTGVVDQTEVLCRIQIPETILNK